MATNALAPKEIFLHAVFFDYATSVLNWGAFVELSMMPPPPAGELVPPPESGVGVAHSLTTEGLPPPLLPMIVNGALAIELYLKALVVHETGTRPQVHKLSELFQKLSGPCRAQVERFYNEEFENAPDLVYARSIATDKNQYKLEKMLTRYNDMFVKIRYSYEWPRLDGSSLTPIRHALLRTILAVKPEWAPLARCLETPPTYLCPPPPIPAE